MLEGYNPVLQASLGTLFTWALTAAGSALVFLFSSGQEMYSMLRIVDMLLLLIAAYQYQCHLERTCFSRKILDGSLGFAAGVMTAASYWSLLEPSIEAAKSSGIYGADGEYAFIPVCIGFVAGASFVVIADKLLPYLGIQDPVLALSLESGMKYDKDSSSSRYQNDDMSPLDIMIDGNKKNKDLESSRRRRAGSSREDLYDNLNGSIPDDSTNSAAHQRQISWKRIVLLILAITVHNIPEGLAVGVGFGAIGKTSSATFAKARNLAIGIGIQNFPEGLAVSLPLRGSGMSVWKSFWYGQLSGMVEPIAGILGAVAVVLAEPLLPYTLAFAAGAMIYVVFDDIIPEAQTCGNGRLASFGAVFGFVVMMSLDVGLG